VTKDGRPRRVSDEALLEAIRDAVRAGDTDPAGGGVHPEVLAERVPLSATTLKARCRDLQQDGRLTKVRGLNPELGSPRWSYKPADDVGSETSTVDS